MKFKCDACAYRCELDWGNNLVPIRCPENYNNFKWVSVEDDENYFVMDGVGYEAVESEPWICHHCTRCAFGRNTCFSLNKPFCSELCRKDHRDVYFIETEKV